MMRRERKKRIKIGKELIEELEENINADRELMENKE